MACRVPDVQARLQSDTKTPLHDTSRVHANAKV